MSNNTATDQRILDAAQQLLQTKGYNGFSYKDIAALVEIKTSSIHYHFATKAILIEAVFERFTQDFIDFLDATPADNHHSLDNLAALCRLFEQVVSGQKFCVCGSLAAVHYALPETVNAQTQRFTAKAKQWIEQVLQQGVINGEVALKTSVQVHAQVIFAALEGAILLAQATQSGLKDYQTTVDGLLALTRAG